MLSAPSSEMLSARPPSLPSCCPTVSGLSSRFTFGGRVRRKLRAHALPDDELLAAPVSLHPSAPDSTVAVHADGGVTLRVERYLDELRLWHDLHHPLLSRSPRAPRSFDHLIRPQQQGRWDRQPKRLRGLEVDDQLEPRRPLDGQVAGLRTLYNLVHVGSGAPKIISNVRSIGHKAPGIHTLPVWEHRRQPVLCREVHEASSLTEEHGAWQHSQSTRARPGHFREGPVEILRTSGLNELRPHPQRLRRDICCLQHVLLGAFAEGTWMPEDGDPTDPRNGLLEKFQTLAD